jgi:hypothetical protein
VGAPVGNPTLVAGINPTHHVIIPKVQFSGNFGRNPEFSRKFGDLGISISNKFAGKLVLRDFD